MSIWESFASNDVAHSSSPTWKALPDTDGPVSPFFTMVHHFSVLNRQLLGGILDFLGSGCANLSYEMRVETLTKVLPKQETIRRIRNPSNCRSTVHLNSAVNLLKLIAQLCQSLLE